MSALFFRAAKHAFGNSLSCSQRFLSSLDRPLVLPLLNTARSSRLSASPPPPERLPATFGLISWSGFEEMLLRGARLPARKKITLYGIFDYVRTSEIQVVYRHSPLHTHTEIASVTLLNIRQALAKDTFIHATMEIDNSLNGRFHVCDPFTESEAWTEFDARVPPEHGHLVGNGRAQQLSDGGPDISA